MLQMEDKEMITPSYITAEMSKNFDEAVRLGVEAGVNTVAIRSNIWGKDVTKIDDDDITRMKSVLSKYGANIGVIFSPVGKCNIEDLKQVEKHMEIFKRMVELAHVFDTPFIRIFPFRRPNYEEYEPSHLDEYLDLIVKRLNPIVEIAEAENIILCMECVGSTLARTAQDIRKVIDAFGNSSPVLKVAWEILVACKDGELPSEGYKFVRGFVQDVHVKRNPDKKIDPVWTSQDSYEAAFRSSLDDGYDGFATIEHWGSKEGTLDGIRQLKEILSKLQ